MEDGTDDPGSDGREADAVAADDPGTEGGADGPATPDDPGTEGGADDAVAADGERPLLSGDGRLQPGRPDPEHVAFVLLGVAASLLVWLSLTP